jgi:hypothetical protein
MGRSVIGARLRAICPSGRSCVAWGMVHVCRSKARSTMCLRGGVIPHSRHVVSMTDGPSMCCLQQKGEAMIEEQTASTDGTRG